MRASSPARPAGTSEPEEPGPGARHGEPSEEERPMQTCHVHVRDCGTEGCYAEVPTMPGCRTEGDTEAEVRSNIAEAIALYREVTPGDIRPFDSRHCHREGGRCIEIEA